MKKTASCTFDALLDRCCPRLHVQLADFTISFDSLNEAFLYPESHTNQ